MQKGDYRERAAELDSTKSKKSLAEIYEDEYNQKVLPAALIVDSNNVLFLGARR